MKEEIKPKKEENSTLRDYLNSPRGNKVANAIILGATLLVGGMVVDSYVGKPEIIPAYACTVGVANDENPQDNYFELMEIEDDVSILGRTSEVEPRYVVLRTSIGDVDSARFRIVDPLGQNLYDLLVQDGEKYRVCDVDVDQMASGQTVDVFPHSIERL